MACACSPRHRRDRQPVVRTARLHVPGHLARVEGAVVVVEGDELGGALVPNAPRSYATTWARRPASTAEPAAPSSRMAIWLPIVPDGTNSAAALPTRAGERLLERPHRGVLAIAVVADVGVGHRPPHRRRRPGDRVGAEIDEHGRNLPSVAAAMAPAVTAAGELLDLATDAAAAAADLLLAGVRTAPHERASPRRRSPTWSPRWTTPPRRWCATHLLGARPADGFLGEETGLTAGASGIRWVVDPLDGTTNYLYGFPGWNVSIAAEDEAGPVAAVVADPLARRRRSRCARRRRPPQRRRRSPARARPSWRPRCAPRVRLRPGRRRAQAAVLGAVIDRIRDIRRGGAAAVDLCSVACGRVDAYWERGLGPWDLAAGSLIAREAGATVAGDAELGFTLAAPPALFGPLRDLLGRSRSRRGVIVTGSQPAAWVHVLRGVQWCRPVCRRRPIPSPVPFASSRPRPDHDLPPRSARRQHRRRVARRPPGGARRQPAARRPRSPRRRRSGRPKAPARCGEPAASPKGCPTGCTTERPPARVTRRCWPPTKTTAATTPTTSRTPSRRGRPSRRLRTCTRVPALGCARGTCGAGTHATRCRARRAAVARRVVSGSGEGPQTVDVSDGASHDLAELTERRPTTIAPPGRARASRPCRRPPRRGAPRRARTRAGGDCSAR